MTDSKRHREWWINEDCTYAEVCPGTPSPIAGTWIHVIEHSAYEAVSERLAAAKAEIAAIEAGSLYREVIKLRNQCADAQAQLQKSRRTCDEWAVHLNEVNEVNAKLLKQNEILQFALQSYTEVACNGYYLAREALKAADAVGI